MNLHILPGLACAAIAQHVINAQEPDANETPVL